jgi:hypothetical protein
MDFKKFDRPPLSGDFEERHFGRADPNPLWIKISVSDFEEWAGSFANGDIGFINEKIAGIDDSRIGILINGAFYVVDIKTKELLLTPKPDIYNDFEITPDENLLIVAAYCGLFIFENLELVKNIMPDAIDGIRFIGREGDILKGEIYDPGIDWSEFELNLKTLIMKWGMYEY